MALAAEEVREAQLAALARGHQRAAPVSLARDRALPVLPALEPLLPDGLRRGSVLGVAGGPGGTTLALATVVAASAAGSWTALVGAPALGWQAALELGLVPERLLAVPVVPRESWATVVASLLDAVDVVVAAAPRVGAAEARRLVARGRERGAVLVALPGTAWPGADVRLSVTGVRWEGPAGGGAGRLEARRAEVAAEGRGAAARPRRAELWLPGRDGRVTPA